MDYIISPIREKDNIDVARIIKLTGAEFGAVGDGYGTNDAEVEHMSQYYTEDTKSLYLVLSIDNKIVGGGGIAALKGAENTCELKKLFLLHEARGLGLGKKIAEQCLAFAEQQGYQQCYLDTLKTMDAARALYEKLGFTYLDKQIGDGIHSGCDQWMLKSLINK